MIPSVADREKIRNDHHDPWEFNEAFSSQDKFEAALHELDRKQPSDVNITFSDSWRRIFHPKGTPYGIQAGDILALIAENFPGAAKKEAGDLNKPSTATIGTGEGVTAKYNTR